MTLAVELALATVIDVSTSAVIKVGVSSEKVSSNRIVFLGGVKVAGDIRIENLNPLISLTFSFPNTNILVARTNFLAAVAVGRNIARWGVDEALSAEAIVPVAAQPTRIGASGGGGGGGTTNAGRSCGTVVDALTSGGGFRGAHTNASVFDGARDTRCQNTLGTVSVLTVASGKHTTVLSASISGQSGALSTR